MTEETYGSWSDYDRNEMFAIGAAAGALIATVIQEALDRRRKTPKTPLERASDRVSAIVDESGEYVSNLSKRSRKQLKRAQKAARKQAAQSGKQVEQLKGAAAGAVAAAASAGVVEKALDLAQGRKAAKRKRGWLSRAGEAAQEQVQAAREAAQEQVQAAREVVQSARPAKKRSTGWWNASTIGFGKASTNGKSAGARIETVGESLREYLEGARGVVSDADLGTKARGAAMGARERIEDAKLRERAREAAATASTTLKDAAETARERLEEAKLRERAREAAEVAGETVKDYSTKAGKAARVSAVRLGEGASHVAESTTEGAKDLRKGVKKRVKKTRRRINWGLRAFIIGLAVGLLTAPQSGERTRQTVQGFIENLLDLVLPDEQPGGTATL